MSGPDMKTVREALKEQIWREILADLAKKKEGFEPAKLPVPALPPLKAIPLSTPEAITAELSTTLETLEESTHTGGTDRRGRSVPQPMKDRFAAATKAYSEFIAKVDPAALTTADKKLIKDTFLNVTRPSERSYSLKAVKTGMQKISEKFEDRGMYEDTLDQRVEAATALVKKGGKWPGTEEVYSKYDAVRFPSAKAMLKDPNPDTEKAALVALSSARVDVNPDVRKMSELHKNLTYLCNILAGSQTETVKREIADTLQEMEKLKERADKYCQSNSNDFFERKAARIAESIGSGGNPREIGRYAGEVEGRALRQQQIDLEAQVAEETHQSRMRNDYGYQHAMAVREAMQRNNAMYTGRARDFANASPVILASRAAEIKEDWRKAKDPETGEAGHYPGAESFRDLNAEKGAAEPSFPRQDRRPLAGNSRGSDDGQAVNTRRLRTRLAL